ncbi:MAG: hypothetical protein JRE71_00520 [Deltaproteobacteria bacterium]|nr:hypothetical protein [Deltaproteobacteria bacterium]
MNWHLRFWRITLVVWLAGLAYIANSIGSRRGEPAFHEPFATVLSTNTGIYLNAISTLAYWEEVGTLWVFICSWSVVAWGTFYTIDWMVGGLRRW